MDMSSPPRLADGAETPAPSDVPAELMLSLEQAVPTGCAETDGAAALIELLVGGPRWQEAIARQGGSFHPGLCAAGAKQPSTEMTGKFTLAF